MYPAKSLVLAIAAAAALGACSGDAAPTVEMTSGQRFTPGEITISAGDEIVFTNTSGEAHSVTAYSDGFPEGAEYFSSGGFATESEARDNITQTLVKAGDSFELALTEPGTYRYFCIPHEEAGMVGRIVVE
ncbi:MAG: plastocyanin/azurin family copper-binding protein [Actinomycetota bacterium]